MRHIGLLLFFGLLLHGPLYAQLESADSQCLDCHVKQFDPAMKRLANTVHGNLSGEDDSSCVACHGSSTEHQRSPIQAAPDTSFGPRWGSDPQARSASCLSCHEQREQQMWIGSGHERENLACDDCHSTHDMQDLALDSHRSEQACLGCHQQVQSEIRLPSRHPVEEGKTGCSDCHNPHGGLGDADLVQLSVNDNCLSCHQEKRGPFLWEHAPVAEDCSLCHRPHGSVHDRLLTARGPALCQQCHSAAFHPSQPYGAEGLPAGKPNHNLLGKNCLNCHSQVHGSNHPSGGRLTR